MYSKYFKGVGVRGLLLFLFIFALTSCANVEHYSDQPQWDFDHEVQYRESRLADNKYHIEVISRNDTHFATLATFLLRRSMEICQSYGFKIEVLKGIESFDERQGLPNMILPSLAANLECPAK